jgi:hypothetical protein
VEPNGSGRRIKLVDAIREIVSGWSAAFGRDLLRKTIESKYPGLKTETVSVYLIDMARRGELTREGTGKAAIYRRLKLKGKFSVSEKEAAYQEFRKTIPTAAAED